MILKEKKTEIISSVSQKKMQEFFFNVPNTRFFFSRDSVEYVKTEDCIRNGFTNLRKEQI
jgi:hypothetical protein